jgi:hypothetical protein
MRRTAGGRSERGMGLILCITIVAFLVSMCGAFLAIAIAQSKSASTKRQGENVNRALDGAVAIAMTRIHRTLEASLVPAQTFGGTIPAASTAGLPTAWSIEIRRNIATPTLWKISAAAANGEAHRSQQVIVERPPALPPVPGTFRGALSSYFGFPDLKNIQVTGNDVLSADGTPNAAGTNTFGISTKVGPVSFSGGSGQLGGAGKPLAHKIDAERVESDYGGLDFPTDPLEALQISNYPSDTKTFNTLAEWNSYVATLPFDDKNGDGVVGKGERIMPDNQFLNLTFKDGGTTMFDEVNWGTSEHILIWHHEDPTINNDPAAPKGDATAQNIHLGEPAMPFKGIAVLDDWRHVNGSSSVRGGMISLSGVVNTGMQGNTMISFSSQAVQGALARAGKVAKAGTPPRIVSYRENVNDAETRTALGAVGITITNLDGEESIGWEVPD